MILGIPVYGLLLWLLPEVAFLHHMAITFHRDQRCSWLP